MQAGQEEREENLEEVIRVGEGTREDNESKGACHL